VTHWASGWPSSLGPNNVGKNNDSPAALGQQSGPMRQTRLFRFGGASRAKPQIRPNLHWLGGPSLWLRLSWRARLAIEPALQRASPKRLQWGGKIGHVRLRVGLLVPSGCGKPLESVGETCPPFHLILFHSISSHPIPFHLISSHLVLSHLISAPLEPPSTGGAFHLGPPDKEWAAAYLSSGTMGSVPARSSAAD